MNVDVKYFDDHEHGFDTVAEIPGADPKLKDQVVMVGGYLDSWIGGTGATDNGAGTIVGMEAVRITPPPPCACGWGPAKSRESSAPRAIAPSTLVRPLSPPRPTSCSCRNS